MASDFETVLRLMDAFGSSVELDQYKDYSGGNFLPNFHADRLSDENSTKRRFAEKKLTKVLVHIGHNEQLLKI